MTQLLHAVLAPSPVSGGGTFEFLSTRFNYLRHRVIFRWLRRTACL